MTPERLGTCYRCGAVWHDEDGGWLILNLREDGWFIAVCPDCQTNQERDKVDAPALDPD